MNTRRPLGTGPAGSGPVRDPDFLPASELRARLLPAERLATAIERLEHDADPGTEAAHGAGARRRPLGTGQADT
ncbi:hypothetical protein [Streptomyces sp. NPDC051129]|uniref:hypothetical protein n=1 Tax=Streptomyces sp. NPDC051129 TaxID=3154639 RepID=UPI00343FCDAA